MTTVPIALIQTRTPASAAAAFTHVEPLIRQAAVGGAKLILTPEGTNFLIQDRERRAAALETQDRDEAVGKLRALARELGVWLLIGSAIVRSGHEGDDRAANRSLLIDDGGEVIAKLDHDEPGVLFATLDLDAVARARAAVPQLSHDREFGAPS